MGASIDGKSPGLTDYFCRVTVGENRGVGEKTVTWRLPPAGKILIRKGEKLEGEVGDYYW